MNILIKNLNAGDEKFNRLLAFLDGEDLGWSSHKPVLTQAHVSGSSVPVAEQSMGTMFDEDYKKLKEQQCSHPDIGTDGGGDYCKSCGKRWSR